MAPSNTTVTVKGEKLHASQLDKTQTNKASNALLKHLKEANHEREASSKTKNLLGLDNHPSEETIWLITTTKKHIVPQKRLKPSKILLPHTLNTSSALSICLITPDPQRSFKDVIAHTSFPKELSSMIARVIDIKKLEKKYHSFESKRQLKDSYDLFLADDRIITFLPKILGKTFYTSTTKRPIPVRLQASKTKEEKKNVAFPSSKTKKDELESRSIIDSAKFGQEIHRTLQMTMVNLTPSATTAVRVGLASLTPNQLAENVEAVTEAMVENFVPKKWKGIKAIHIKGPNSIALPIWLAEEMWEDEGEVLEEAEAEQARVEAMSEKKRRRMLKGIEKNGEGRKRGIEDADGTDNGVTKSKRRMVDTDLSQEMRVRREKLRQQKQDVRAKLGGKELRSAAVAPS